MAVTFEFSGHALQRMFEREITIEAVKTAVASGEVIAEYPDDRPDPALWNEDMRTRR